MGRLARRLGIEEKPEPEVDYDFDTEDLGEYYPEEETTTPMPDEDRALIREYERLQIEALKAEQKQKEAFEKTNPHTLYNEVLADPSPPHKFEMTLPSGRKVSLAKLEHYLIHDLSPKSIVNQCKQRDASVYDKIKGGGNLNKKSFKLGPIWIMLGAMAIFIITMVFITQGQAIAEFFGSLFSGGNAP